MSMPSVFLLQDLVSVTEVSKNLLIYLQLVSTLCRSRQNYHHIHLRNRKLCRIIIMTNPFAVEMVTSPVDHTLLHHNNSFLSIPLTHRLHLNLLELTKVLWTISALTVLYLVLTVAEVNFRHRQLTTRVHLGYPIKLTIPSPVDTWRENPL